MTVTASKELADNKSIQENQLEIPTIFKFLLTRSDLSEWTMIISGCFSAIVLCCLAILYIANKDVMNEISVILINTIKHNLSYILPSAVVNKLTSMLYSLNNVVHLFNVALIINVIIVAALFLTTNYFIVSMQKIDKQNNTRVKLKQQ